MDAIDREITRLLQTHGRLTQEQLARQVHLSRPAVHERIKRLEEQGVIRGYQALVDWEALGWCVTAFVWVRTTGRCDEAALRVASLRDESAMVAECHRVTGEWCLLLKTRATSSRGLQALIDRIRDVPGVQGTMTTVVLSTVSDDGGECDDEPEHRAGAEDQRHRVQDRASR
jgi:Lrp/AsnC family leucine-responsive transcriptional regulator